MTTCWRRWRRACRIARVSRSASIAWSPWRSVRRKSPTPWPLPSTTPKNAVTTPGPARTPLVLAARQVLAGASVDPQNLALVDEQRDPHHGAGFQLRGLGSAGSGIAANSGIRLDHLELHLRRRGHLQRHAVPPRDHA